MSRRQDDVSATDRRRVAMATRGCSGRLRHDDGRQYAASPQQPPQILIEKKGGAMPTAPVCWCTKVLVKDYAMNMNLRCIVSIC